jgi:hypothetical protein
MLRKHAMLIKREVNQSKTRMEKVKFKIVSEIINLTNTGPKQN